MTYKGYTIEAETCPWAIKYSGVIKYFIDSEKVMNADTVEEAKDQIDEILGEVEPVKATFAANTGRLLLHKKVNGLIFLTPIPFII